MSEVILGSSRSSIKNQLWDHNQNQITWSISTFIQEYGHTPTKIVTKTELSKQTIIQNQNNYIQINDTVLSQETIKNLSPEQLSTIEMILKTSSTRTEALNDDVAE